MRYVSKIIAALFCILFAASPAGAGSMLLTGVGPPSAAAGGYVGPGDQVPSAVAWYGLRGYSAAYSTGSNPAVDLVDQAGANQITINIKANGDIDVAAISAWVAANSVTTIKVKKLYDQSGNAHHTTMGTLAKMIPLGLNVLGSHPALQPTATTSIGTGSDGTNAITTVQTLTQSAVAKRTGAAALGQIFGAIGASPGIFFSGNANNAKLFAGSQSADVAATDSTWHAFQAVFAGSSSTLMVDGSTTPALNPGAGGYSGTSVNAANGINADTSFPFIGSWLEGGLWAGAISGPDQTSLDSRQHAYWGF